MKRKQELFGVSKLQHDVVVHQSPSRLYPQERDWTCSIACIRTLLSGVIDSVPSEDSFLEMYHLTPHAYYSKDIKQLGILGNYDVIYGCDHADVKFDDILQYMQDGYYVMVETMYNYSHWYVLQAYLPVEGEDIEHSKLLIFDPYYRETRLLNTDEFLGMWIDGDYHKSHVKRDFIAVR